MIISACKAVIKLIAKSPNGSNMVPVKLMRWAGVTVLWYTHCDRQMALQAKKAKQVNKYAGHSRPKLQCERNEIRGRAWSLLVIAPKLLCPGCSVICQLWLSSRPWKLGPYVPIGTWLIASHQGWRYVVTPKLLACKSRKAWQNYH